MTGRQMLHFDAAAEKLYAERASYFRRIQTLAAEEGASREAIDGYVRLIDNINRSLIALSEHFSGMGQDPGSRHAI